MLCFFLRRYLLVLPLVFFGHLAAVTRGPPAGAFRPESSETLTHIPFRVSSWLRWMHSRQTRSSRRLVATHENSHRRWQPNFMLSCDEFRPCRLSSTEEARQRRWESSSQATVKCSASSATPSTASKIEELKTETAGVPGTGRHELGESLAIVAELESLNPNPEPADKPEPVGRALSDAELVHARRAVPGEPCDDLAGNLQRVQTARPSESRWRKSTMTS